jgi:hypothetical protein
MIDTTVRIAPIECCKCHVLFWLSAQHSRRLEDEGETFYCPAGHSQSYKDTIFVRHKAELEKLKQSYERANQQTRNCLERRETALTNERNKHIAMKGIHTKAMNRLKNGVCPFCTRSFKDLKRHMSSQHSDTPCHPES